MIIEKRTPIKSYFSKNYNINNKKYQLNGFVTSLNNQSGVAVILHEVDNEFKINLDSKKLCSVFFNNKDLYSNFLNLMDNYFNPDNGFKNMKNILLDLEKSEMDNIWINPNFIFKSREKSYNSDINNHNGYVDVNKISILSLIDFNSDGKSILSSLNIIDNDITIKSEGDEVKCKIKIKGKEKIFSINTKNNFFSDWTKGVDSFSGHGALSFISLLTKCTKEDATKLLFKIFINNKDKELLFKESDNFKFKSSYPLPIQTYDQSIKNKVVNYLMSIRGISENIAIEMIDKNVVSYAKMLRVPKDLRYKTKGNDKKGNEIDKNLPKYSINSDVFYFPLYGINNEIQSIQYLSLDPNFKKKLNFGSTSGIYSGINNNSDKYILSEAAFDNIALYELSKQKIDVNQYNFFSCQSVGGVESWIEKKFGVVFSIADDNSISIKKSVINESTIDIPVSYIEKLKKEIFGNENERSRNFFFVYNKNDSDFISKGKIIHESLKKIDEKICIKWIESENRFINYYDFYPLDIVLDNTSIDQFLLRNNLTIANGLLQIKKYNNEIIDFTNDEILEFSKKFNVDTIISACDNDSAGHAISEKLSIMCEFFNLKYADWSPKNPYIKDHNDCLKIVKGIPINFENDNKEIIELNPNDFKKSDILSYIDESNISLLKQNSKKKIINKAF